MEAVRAAAMMACALLENLKRVLMHVLLSDRARAKRAVRHSIRDRRQVTLGDAGRAAEWRRITRTYQIYG
jgi:hypothetical protein